ncbi:ABC transporter ATP-binding protein [Paenibacillus beijingensis]|uniref:Quaternary amine transport ATP-binding protein n=1 Tax=Paenibacillus beijingensis TaxID=1126833 RepID=A0A0D5NE12_9BACL|nr:ABC transporter ATP-binding protein [Paenibacillus beijingensis]AJY73400.1 ABC transporter ATP-binding protein [Paenibacillus beijingensis]
MSGIEFRNVSKSYPGSNRPAIQNVSFTVESGQFIVLLGSSGCGKTTLLKMVNRLYEQSEGQILIDGEDTKSVSLNDLRRRIGYVIQQSGLFPHMTVEQNISVVPEMLGWDKARISARIDELLELVHLEPKVYRKRYPRQMSGGQQQRVGLARALAADPPFMLMDEPFGAIDAITRTKLQDELVSIQKKLHKTILFVTHDVEEALRMADKIIILKDGDIVQYDTPLEILLNPKNDFVKNLTGGHDLIRQISLINVTDVMEKLDAPYMKPEKAAVSENSDLKTVLTLLLREGEEALHVVNEAGYAVGRVTLSDLQKLWSPAKEKVANSL